MTPPIIVTPAGCHTPTNSSATPFRCQMCRPYAADYSQLTHDNCVACATSKIARGVIYYYYDKVYERDLHTGMKVVKSVMLVEKRVGDVDVTVTKVV